MRSAKTQSIGAKTKNFSPQISRLAILGKNPAYDYSFRRKKEIEEGSGMDEYGYEHVGIGNTDGETWATPVPLKSKGARQIVYQDTILCRRKKEVSQYFINQENEKYNTQKQMISESARNARIQLRKLDPNAVVTDDIKSSDGFSQRPGPTESDLEEKENG